jgi:hypothetical protein
MISRGQAPSDIIMGWADAASVYVHDYSASEYAVPRLDDSEDVQLMSGGGYNTSSKVLSIRWRRLLSTGDPADRAFTPGTPQTVLWALNRNPGAVTSDDGSSFLQHEVSTRGFTTIDFGAPEFSTCAAATTATCGSGHHGSTDDDPTSYSSLVGQCLGNGWTPSEKAGDRDGGAATPRLAAPVPSCLTSPDGALSVGWRVEAGGLLRVSLYNRAGSQNRSSFGGQSRVALSYLRFYPACFASISFRCRFSSGGWAGIGFNSRKSMIGADTIMVSASALTRIQVAVMMIFDPSLSRRPGLCPGRTSGARALGCRPATRPSRMASLQRTRCPRPMRRRCACVCARAGMFVCSVSVWRIFTTSFYFSTERAERPDGEGPWRGKSGLLAHPMRLQDVTLVGVSVDGAAGGATSFTFTRPLFTGDASDADLSARAPPVYLLWAYAAAGAGAMDEHKRAGFASVQLNMTSGGGRRGTSSPASPPHPSLLAQFSPLHPHVSPSPASGTAAAACAAGVLIEAGEPHDAARAAHGALMVIAFWLLLFTGAGSGSAVLHHRCGEWERCPASLLAPARCSHCGA